MNHDRPAFQTRFQAALLRDNEARRLDVLRSLRLMDSRSKQELERITQLASALCQTPIALLALIDERRGWSVSRVGVANTQRLPADAFCERAISGPDVLVVPDALADPRFAFDPGVTGESHIRFFAGAPLIGPEGLALGALCVIDRRSRQPTAEQIDALRTLSRAVMTLVAKRDLERRLAGFETTAQAGTLAHDLNNALAPILSVLEFLSRKQNDTRSRELIALALASADRMSRMVRQMRGAARGAEGAAPPLQTADLIRETERIARETFPSGIGVQAELPGDLWPVAGDPAQILQALLNLCANGRDAMGGRGVLTLGAGNVTIDAAFATLHPDAQPGPHVALFVADTGGGIAPELHERIFEPFFTTRRAARGTGLGLFTALGVVKRHGGFIQFWSRVGEGSTFTVYLPAAARP